MCTWLDSIRRFLVTEDGPTAVEYAIMLALLVLVIYLAVAAIGNNTNDMFSNLALQTATSGGTGS
jgi:pilus assembly protein Flp/PilA